MNSMADTCSERPLLLPRGVVHPSSTVLTMPLEKPWALPPFALLGNPQGCCNTRLSARPMPFAGAFPTALTMGETCPIHTCHLNLLCSYCPQRTNSTLKNSSPAKATGTPVRAFFAYASCLCTEARFAQGSKSQCLIPGWHWPSPVPFCRCVQVLYISLGLFSFFSWPWLLLSQALPFSLLLFISRPQTRQSYQFQIGTSFASVKELQKSLTIMDFLDTHQSLFA